MTDGSITIREINLLDLLETAKRHFLEGIETEKKRREDAEKLRAERIKQQQLEAEHWREEQEKWQEEAEKSRAEEAEKRRLEEEKRAEAERRRDEDFKRNLEEGLNQQETQVRMLMEIDGSNVSFAERLQKIRSFHHMADPLGFI